MIDGIKELGEVVEKDGLEEEECHLLQKVTFYRGKVSVTNEQRLPDDNTDLGRKMGTQREVGEEEAPRPPFAS